VGGQRHAPAVLPPGNDPVPIVQGAGWAPGQVWIGAKGVAPTGVQTPKTVQPASSRYTDYAILTQFIFGLKEVGLLRQKRSGTLTVV